VLSPITAAWAINKNIRDIDDSPGVRVAYLVPGYVWTTGVQIGSSLIREGTGLLELLPGLGLFFFEADLDPLFAPADRAEAIVDLETDILYVKFGINYTAQAF
jgi:hypothetical protein